MLSILLLVCAINPDLKAIAVPRPVGDNHQVGVYIQSRLENMGLPTVRHRFDRGVNIVAPRLGDQKSGVFIVGSHYDSVPNTPGADDNASGCVVNLMIAAKRLKLKHTVVHAFFDDEETGLHGSEAFAKECPSIDLMVNLDMVGRLKPTKYSDPFDTLFRKYPWARSITFRDPGGVLRDCSDHYPFARRGVPVVWLFTGLHRDYHTPTDTSDKINEDGLRMIADYVCAILQEFDNGVDKQWYSKLKALRSEIQGE